MKVLLIGAGGMGNSHAQAYRQIEGACLAGVVDHSEERGTKLAKAMNCPSFLSYEEAIESLDNIDMVDICLPTPLHAEYVMKAGLKYKSILCEKPLALNHADAEQVLQFCRNHGVRLFVGHVVRFYPEYVKLKETVAKGTFGSIAIARMSRLGGLPYADGDWYADVKQSGGVLLDLLIHDFDFLRWCFGDVERVFAHSTATRLSERMEYTLVTIRFRSGTIAHVEGNWAKSEFGIPFSTRYELAGSGGLLEYDSLKEQPLVGWLASKQQAATGITIPESPLAQSPLVKELKHFITCHLTGDAPVVSAEDALEACRISWAAWESARTGQPVLFK